MRLSLCAYRVRWSVALISLFRHLLLFIDDILRYSTNSNAFTTVTFQNVES